MRSGKSLTLMVLVALSAPSLAQAGQASAESDSGFKFGNGDYAGGTSAFFLYAKQFAVPQIQNEKPPNDSTGHSYQGPLDAVQLLPKPTGPSDNLSFGRGSGNPKIYTPTVGTNNRPKPANPYDLEFCNSFSGDNSASGAVQVKSARNAKDQTQASATVARAGETASITYDPYPVTPGLYAYTDSISLSLQKDHPEDFASAYFTATDSRYSDPLWELEVFSPEGTALASKSDLSIYFAFNMDAIHGGVFTDGVGNPLNDAQASSLALDIKNAVFAGLSAGGGSASLTDFELFPDGLFYQVNQSIDYGHGDGAAVTELVPEPSSCLLLMACAWGLGLRGRRR